jgi:hypothetical protein
MTLHSLRIADAIGRVEDGQLNRGAVCIDQFCQPAFGTEKLNALQGEFWGFLHHYSPVQWKLLPGGDYTLPGSRF